MFCPCGQKSYNRIEFPKVGSLYYIHYSDDHLPLLKNYHNTNKVFIMQDILFWRDNCGAAVLITKVEYLKGTNQVESIEGLMGETIMKLNIYGIFEAIQD